MGDDEVDKGVVRIVDATPLALCVVGSGELVEVVARPCDNADDEHDDEKGGEDDEAEKVCAAALFV